MRASLLLAWRYLSHHRLRSSLLALCVALVSFLPFAVEHLVTVFGDALVARARATPLVAGAPGSRYDLVLSSLYFTGRVPRPLSMAEADELRESGLALAVPLLVRNQAQGRPLVGTSNDYYDFRRLVFAAGGPPLLLGDAVLGARVARELSLGVGDTILTDQGSLYDLTLRYPLRMHVVGVLAPNGTPDDGAVFADVKTTWVVEGIGHGHVDAREERDDRVMAERDDEIVLSAATVEWSEITEENIETFHFHGEAEDFPLTAVLVAPRDARGATLLKGRYRVSETTQLLAPIDVVEEILGFVFRLKVFFDANAALVTVATVLFLVLVVLLSIRVRERELETLFKIGCSRGTVVRVFSLELALVIAAGLVVAALLASGLVLWLGESGWALS